MKIQSIYTSKFLKNTLDFANNNSLLFVASTELAFSLLARPLAIALAPKTDDTNKKYAVSKSYASSAVKYLIALCASVPLAKSVKNINNNPEKFLNPKTIDTLKGKSSDLISSKEYNFATQSLKLGLGFLLAIPKACAVSFLVEPIEKKIEKIFPNKKDNKINLIENISKKENTCNLFFKGNPIDGLSKGVSKIINSDTMLNLSKKFSNTNFEHHMVNLTDILATGAFVFNTQKNKKIKNENKKPLIYNSIISTLFCVTGSYATSRIIDKPVQKFIDNFAKANKNDPKLAQYLNGFRVVKPALILATLYYVVIPFISTFISDKLAKNNKD